MIKLQFKNSRLTKEVMNSLFGGVTDPNEDEDFERDKKNKVATQPAQPSDNPSSSTTDARNSDSDY